MGIKLRLKLLQLLLFVLCLLRTVGNSSSLVPAGEIFVQLTVHMAEVGQGGELLVSASHFFWVSLLTVDAPQSYSYSKALCISHRQGQTQVESQVYLGSSVVDDV